MSLLLVTFTGNVSSHSYVSAASYILPPSNCNAVITQLFVLTDIPAIIDDSRNAKTVFRDKSGKRRDLESEREEQRRKAEEKAIKDEKYAQWGIG